MRHSVFLSITGVATVMMTTSVLAAEPKTMGQFKDWSAHVVGDKKSIVCYIHSEPRKTAGKYKKRGRVFVQVANRPAEKVKGEVSVTAGYDYRKKSDVDVDVDGKKFVMFTQRDGAWLKDPKADAALIDAMKKGTKMTVRGASSRGTKTIDTYSLSGFGAAYRAIGKACK